jgi:hypothetical protein
MNELIAVAVIVAAMGGQPASRADREVARLRAHFAQVDRELHARDVSSLTPVQRHARATHIARLRAYAAAGRFPHNTHHPGAYVPYFVDDSGTRCAMGYLIEESGAIELVARVRARLNYRYIAEIARDQELGPELHAWLDANGLSLAEAARIQPSYDGGGCCTVDPPPTEEVATSYKVGSGAAVVTSLATVALNASLFQLGVSRRAGGWIGLGVGAAALVLGASALDEGDEYGTLRLVNGSVGALAAGIGLYALLGPTVMRRAPTARADARVSGTPWVAPDGRSGVLVRMRF